MTIEQLDELYDTLTELADYLDARADVDDGQPNDAMKLFARVEAGRLDIMEARTRIQAPHARP